MKQTALITGASGGLGEEFAKLCASDGMDVVLVARSTDKLQALADELEKESSIKAHVITADLSEVGAAQKLVGELQAKNMVITVLINNAGFGAYGLFYATDYAQEEALLRVNIEALTALTKLLLPKMVERGEGRILNVASTAAFLPGPLMSVYYASKAYVLSFSQGIANEVTGTGVTVSCLCPGPTRTGFASRAKVANTKLFTTSTMTASAVAKIGYRGMLKGKRVIVAGLMNKIVIFVLRFIPQSLAASIARSIQQKKA